MSDVDAKFLESYCKDRFSRPFLRKFRYLYCGLDRCDDIVVLSNIEDTDFRYCESTQATGLVKLHNPEHRSAIKAWLQTYGIDGSVPTLFYLDRAMAILNKASWTSSDVHTHLLPNGVVMLQFGTTPAVMVARPIDTHFVLTKLQSYVDKYTEVFFTQTVPSYTLSLPGAEALNKLCVQPVSCQAIYAAGVLDVPCHDINLMLLPGVDYLVIKSLLSKDRQYDSGIRLWADGSPRCLNYGGYYTDADIAICVVRDHIVLFPKPKPEVPD